MSEIRTYTTATGTIDVQRGDVLEYDDDGVIVRVEVVHAGSSVLTRWVCSILPDGTLVRGNGQQQRHSMWLHDWRHAP